MNEERLKEIEARANAATKGPWRTGRRGVSKAQIFCPEGSLAIGSFGYGKEGSPA